MRNRVISVGLDKNPNVARNDIGDVTQRYMYVHVHATQKHVSMERVEKLQKLIKLSNNIHTLL